MKEPPRIGRNRFEVAPLGLGVQRAEGERRFSGTGNTGKNHQGVARDVEFDIFKIVLARPAHPDKPRKAVGCGLRKIGCHSLNESKEKSRRQKISRDSAEIHPPMDADV